MYLIYLITNLTNGKKYVGQTQMGRSETRWHEHISCVNRSNRILYNAIKKQINLLKADGKTIDNLDEIFSFEIIEENISEDLIDQREMDYIKFYNSFYLDGHGYNMTRGGQGIHGYQHKQETIELIRQHTSATWRRMPKENPEHYAELCANRSKKLKGKPKSEEHKKKLSIQASTRVGEKNSFYGKHFSDESKEKLREAHAKHLNPINAFSLSDGHLYKTFRSIKDAIRDLSLPACADSRILLVCKNNKGHAYDYIWRYKKDADFLKLPGDQFIAEHKTPRAKSVLQFTLDGTLITEFESAACASSALQEDISKQRSIAKGINEACNGRKKTAYGFCWTYKELT